MIELSVRGRARRVVPRARRQALVERLERATQAAGVGETELSLSLVDDDEIRELNRDFRYTDSATDVLSFSMREGEMAPSAGEPETLGDIVISVETAARQAAEARREIDAELLHLAVHGLAHLLGYDHATLAEERVMFGFEARLREQSLAEGAVENVPRPRPPKRR